MSVEEVSDWISEEAAPLPTPAPAPARAESLTPVQPKTAIAEEDPAIAEDGGDEPIEPRDPNGRYRRSKAQRATAEDVPRIRQLTAKLRQAERERDELKASRSAPATESRALPATPMPVQVSDFSEPEPKIDDFIDKSDDPYAAHLRATAAWDRRKEAHDSKVEQSKASVSKFEGESKAFWDGVEQKFIQRVGAFGKANPEGIKALQALPAFTPLMNVAIRLSDTAEADLLHWAQHPSMLLEDLILLTDGKPITEEAVALVQRRLRARGSQAAPTGSAAPAVQPPAPRPPNPVRTGPMKTDDTPGDEDSLESHERHYYKAGRRRR